MTTDTAPVPTGPNDRAAHASGRGYLLRSEEQLRVRTDQVVAGYARLEKFTVTETKTITVEVTHEEVRLVQRAADGLERQAPGPSAAEGDRWMVLSREEVVVSKTVVPVERVRLEVYPVVEERQVTEEVRREHIDTAPDVERAATKDHGPLS